MEIHILVARHFSTFQNDHEEAMHADIVIVNIICYRDIVKIKISLRN